MNKVIFNGKEFTRNGKKSYSHAYALISPSGEILGVKFSSSEELANRAARADAIFYAKNSTRHHGCSYQVAACA